MNKRGLSAIVTTVLITLLIIASVSIIALIIIPFLEVGIDEQVVSMELSKEKIELSNITFYESNGTEKIDLSIKRGTTSLVKTITEIITENISTEEPVPIDIMLSIDLSGSMSLDDGEPETRLTKAKIATIDFVETVLAGDELAKIGLVGFKDNLPANNNVHDLSNDLTSLNNEIDSWFASGGTYVCKGMDKALEIFNNNEIEGREKVLVILGDGDTTLSSCKYGGAEDLAESFYENKNISVSTIGFGPSTAITFFEDIAAAGQGQFYDSSDTNNLANTYISLIDDIQITREVTKTIVREGILFLQVLIFTGGNSHSYTISENLPGEYDTKRFTVPLPNGITEEDVTKIEIYLSVVSGGIKASSNLLTTWEP
ncbi:VWA domain-containing protein [archaeon]|nr:VWA domain-containing protein [archaeon]MBT7128794.1 VWA domain-containing protein [archaeon]